MICFKTLKIIPIVELYFVNIFLKTSFRMLSLIITLLTNCARLFATKKIEIISPLLPKRV